MITLEDCLAMSGLTKEDIDAIAEHEHLPEIIAAELGSYLSGRPGGAREIRRMILDDIAAANLRGDVRHGAQLRRCLLHFCREHPEVREQQTRRTRLRG